MFPQRILSSARMGRTIFYSFLYQCGDCIPMSMIPTLSVLFGIPAGQILIPRMMIERFGSFDWIERHPCARFWSCSRLMMPGGVTSLATRGLPSQNSRASFLGETSTRSILMHKSSESLGVHSPGQCESADVR